MKQVQIYEICKNFRNNPVRYAQVFLGVNLSKDQKAILTAITTPPYKVLVRSHNNAGKSFISAVAALYFFDCYEQSITIITSSVFRQISEIIFKEVRTLGRDHEGFSPKAPLLFDNPKHQIIGITASDETRFQGIHDINISIIADEAVGIEEEFWNSMHSMLGGVEAYFFLASYNPTDQSSYAYTAEKSGAYTVIELNALKHDNITAELQGLDAPFPSAIRLERLRDWVTLWCDPVSEPTDKDFLFEGRWYRASPVGEARILGRWPQQASNCIWTEYLFEQCCQLDLPRSKKVQMGFDPAAFGDDDSVIAIREGGNLIYLESHNGWSPTQSAHRLVELAKEYHHKYEMKPPERIPICIDDTGIGAALRDLGQGQNFIPINFAASSSNKSLYSSKRDEIHFTIADVAKKGGVSFKLLPQHQQNTLREELMAQTYTLDVSGRRKAEPKLLVKKKIGRSPDTADAVMLAFMEVHSTPIAMRPVNLPVKQRPFRV